MTFVEMLRKWRAPSTDYYDATQDENLLKCADEAQEIYDALWKLERKWREGKVGSVRAMSFDNVRLEALKLCADELAAILEEEQK